MAFQIDPNYNEVKDRIEEFRTKYPTGSLQSEVIRWPEEGFPFVAVKAWAYRMPDDPLPGIGLAWENVPGKTTYTKDSELMNAETSAWGRALIAVGAASAKKGVASGHEVRRAQDVEAANPDAPPALAQASVPASTPSQEPDEAVDPPADPGKSGRARAAAPDPPQDAAAPPDAHKYVGNGDDLCTVPGCQEGYREGHGQQGRLA